MRALFLLSSLILFEAFLCDDRISDHENCGGSFSGLQYTIVSPNYPNNYPANRNCVYALNGSPSAKCDQDFHLQFLDFELAASEGCDRDYVKIGSGSVYCGSNLGIRKFKGQNKSLEVIFHSDANTTAAKGFKILVTTLPCASTRIEQTQNSSISGSNNDSERETVRNSGPRLNDDDNRRADQAPSRLRNRISQVKNLSEHLELPEFEQHHFHDENCGHAYAVNDDGIGSITPYLYLPPVERPGPLKKSAAQTIPNEIVIRHFDDLGIEDVDVAEPPADLILPSRQIPPPFEGQVLGQTERRFQPLRSGQSTSQFHELSNRWLTYGIPNSSPSPANPAIPTNNFDPFSNNNYYPNNNNNNNNPGVGYNPGAPNCGRDPNNPNYYPNDKNNNNDNGNWRPNSNPGGYPETGINFDTGFGVNADNNPNYFGNYYPNNNNNNNENDHFYGSVDDTTYYGSRLSQCCGSNGYSSDNFLLTNPGFPALIYSSSNYECQYTIQRASQNVCQLQMYLKFFNFGSDDQFCAYGYLDIDGRRICGCKTGANLTVSFDNIAAKTITVKYLGYPRAKFSGFVIEVSQVSCSTNYLRLRNNQRQNPAFFPPRGKRDLGYSYQKPNSAALTTTGQNLFLGSCQVFKFLNWVKAAKQVYLRSAQCSGGTGSNGVSSSISVIPIFPDTGNAALVNYPSSSNCETVNVVEGTISSPYYPSNYSNNLNQCYRFSKAPGYCQLELAILDFDLENSTFCRRDYVSFSGQKRRYCGTSLAGSRTIFDMTRANFADLYFVTDSSGTARGFRAGFTQISC